MKKGHFLRINYLSLSLPRQLFLSIFFSHSKVCLSFSWEPLPALSFPTSTTFNLSLCFPFASKPELLIHDETKSWNKKSWTLYLQDPWRSLPRRVVAKEDQYFKIFQNLFFPSSFLLLCPLFERLKSAVSLRAFWPHFATIFCMCSTLTYLWFLEILRQLRLHYHL